MSVTTTQLWIALVFTTVWASVASWELYQTKRGGRSNE